MRLKTFDSKYPDNLELVISSQGIFIYGVRAIPKDLALDYVPNARFTVTTGKNGTRYLKTCAKMDPKWLSSSQVFNEAIRVINLYLDKEIKRLKSNSPLYYNMQNITPILLASLVTLQYICNI